MENLIGFGMGSWSMGMPPFFFMIMPFLIIWSIAWKGLGLWHAAQRKDTWWFVAMLVINTLGILEIVYLFGMAKLKFDELFTSKVHQS